MPEQLVARGASIRLWSNADALKPSPLMGEGWVGVSVVQGCGDDGMHAIRIAEHIVVPEADYEVAFGLDQSSPLGIDDLIVLSAVTLDHEAGTMACEIDDVVAERDLLSEACIGKGFAQQPPHRFLGIGRIRSE